MRLEEEERERRSREVEVEMRSVPRCRGGEMRCIECREVWEEGCMLNRLSFWK